MKEIYPDLWQTRLEIPFGAVHVASPKFRHQPLG